MAPAGAPSIPSLGKIIHALADARAELQRSGAPSIPSLTKTIEAMANARAGLANSKLPSIPSLHKAIEALANARAGLGNSSHPSIPKLHEALEALARAGAAMANGTTNNDTSLDSAKAALVSRSPLAAMASGNSSNSSNIFTPLVQVDPENVGLVVASYIILGVFFAIFLYIVGIDMVRKGRTGELQEDLEGTKRLVITAGKSIPRLMVKGASKQTNVMTSKKKKQHDVESAEEAAAREKNVAETRAIIDRLAGSSSHCAGAVGTLAKVISKSVLDPMRASSEGSASETKEGLFVPDADFIVCDSSASSVV
ncbi:hypothetical protein K4F52_006170 [Lecanicillium sp. MT-2017a]|nr:hypothetical protein K4F52_006170 [Lecanicillium sp. MT-2017a]